MAVAAVFVELVAVVAHDDDDSVFEVARAVETTARLYCQASATGIDEPVGLPAAELETVARKLEAYGQSGRP